MEECLGAMPLRVSGYRPDGSGRVCRACGPRFELRLPAGILARPVGTLPRHALPWPLAERDVSVRRLGTRQVHEPAASDASISAPMALRGPVDFLLEDIYHLNNDVTGSHES